ncbi:hypothetical protein [Vulcanisaeta souniana]|uniref:Uncharacterized protein n=1 Tax=Vulcanisaeta souniana JCM 11219 TaxID=1293586 RepID=A0A830ECY5_9CREN|nr:hypothetical protein [Vulcanisaeta souniana]BDR91775.1 hypothetical protein Vsou_08680 [Vulcanisaeta souniana JCM 11219]GGI70501.1 hypothetical protein GCM10007112_04300 [Vulcanisaeta souniana JCM 11219]
MFKRVFFGGLFNELSQDVYKRWFVYQMRVSQALLGLSIASFVIGSAILALRLGHLHGDLMLGGLVLFYIGIMFSQHPGFTRVMPSPFASLLIGLLSITWFVTYVFGLWFSWIVGVLLVLYYVLLIIRGGLGRKPLYWPNTFFLSGLIGLAIAFYMGSGLGLLVFPVASIVSLMRRVESRQKPIYAIDVSYAVLLPIMTYFLSSPIALAVLSLLTLVVIGIPRGFGPAFKTIYSRAYPIGSSLGRASLVITAILLLIGVPLGDAVHMLFLGFIAVIMSSLCIPMLNPGILWFSMRHYGIAGFEIPALLFVSAILRAMYYIVGPLLIMVSLVLVFIAYIEVAVSYLSGERIKVF